MAQITVVGNLGSEPELKSFQGNNGEFVVASFTLADTPREKDKATGEWRDGITTWYRVSLVGKLAELATHISKGDKVIVVGDFKQNSYTSKTGEQKQSLEIKATNIGIVPKAKSARAVSSYAEEESAW